VGSCSGGLERYPEQFSFLRLALPPFLNRLSSATMNDEEQLIATLATAVPSRPSGLIPLLKRTPNSLRWKLIIAS
jgi:hypothetical protein